MPSGSDTPWRILIALLVYNGEEFVGKRRDAAAAQFDRRETPA